MFVACCWLAPNAARAEEFNQISHLTASLSPRGVFVIEARIGDIRIEGWDETRVEIEAEKIVRARSQAQARRMFNLIRIVLKEEDEGLSLRTIYPSRRPWRLFKGETRLSANLRIRLPSETNLTLHCVDGDVTVRGMKGHQQIRVNYGDVEVTVPSLDRLRSLKAKTFLGYVQSDLHGENDAGFGRSVGFWNPEGEQNIAVRVRMGGVFIYHGG